LEFVKPRFNSDLSEAILRHGLNASTPRERQANRVANQRVNRVRPSLIILITLFLAQVPALSAAPGILRCVSVARGAAAEIRYQMEACPPGFTQTTLLIADAPTPVAGEPILSSHPGQASSTKPRAAGATTSRRTNSHAKRTTTQVTKPRRPKKMRHEAALSVAGCPPTYEDGGAYVVANRSVKTPSGSRSKAHSGMRAAWEDYKSLPTKTYLKNAGRWPKGCPP